MADVMVMFRTALHRQWCVCLSFFFCRYPVFVSEGQAFQLGFFVGGYLKLAERSCEPSTRYKTLVSFSSFPFVRCSFSFPFPIILSLALGCALFMLRRILSRALFSASPFAYCLNLHNISLIPAGRFSSLVFFFF